MDLKKKFLSRNCAIDDANCSLRIYSHLKNWERQSTSRLSLYCLNEKRDVHSNEEDDRHNQLVAAIEFSTGDNIQTNYNDEISATKT